MKMPSSSAARSTSPPSSTRAYNSPTESSSLLKHPIPQILKNFNSFTPSEPNNTAHHPKPISTKNHHHLTSGYHLAGLVNHDGGTYEKYRKSAEELKKMSSSKVRKFYERQNEILDYFLEVDSVLDDSHRGSIPRLATPAHRPSNDGLESLSNLESGSLLTTRSTDLHERILRTDRENKENLSVRWIINVNFLTNFFLLTGKIVVALLSNSISLIASLVDSAMDFLSTAIIWWTNQNTYSTTWQSVWQYPAGKGRMEPMGVVVFSVFMISSFVQVLIESIERLFSGSTAALSIPFTSIVVMCVTIVVKGIVWLWCRKDKNTSVKALAQDAENDCVVNTFSLLVPYLGLKFHLPWLDAVGGLMLSLYIITEWTKTLIDNVQNLTGRRADPIQHQRVAYLVTRFSPLIQALQHCHVYQAGDDLIVETDVILSPDTSLPIAHDVGESVQYALESLEGVSRAYCHVDFSSNPMSGHFQR